MKLLAPLLILALQQAPPADPKKELALAAMKSLDLDNYAFKGRIEVEGVPFLSEPIDFRGAFVKDRGFTAEMGPFGTVFRLDKKVAVKEPGGAWVFLARNVNKVGDGALASHIPMIGRGLRPPHEELKKFETRFKEIAKREEKTAVVYEGPLTEGGIRASLPAGIGYVLGKGKFEGKGRAWVADGKVIRFESEAVIEIDDGENTSELKFKRTTEFVDAGKAVVEMPAEVKKLFED